LDLIQAFSGSPIMAGLNKNKDFLPPIAADGERTTLRPLVLIVEDHEDTRSLYRYVLELHGYDVVETDRGEEAIRLAKDLHPDLVLMDTNLPEIDGLTATHRMREHASLRDLPIIFVSGHAQPELRAAALAAGGDDYLVKPTSLSELEASVDRFLTNGRRGSRGEMRRGEQGNGVTGKRDNMNRARGEWAR
jgi:DNA-binding response OmpR family regulator